MLRGGKFALTVLLDPTEDIVHVVREESTTVQHCLNQTRDSLERHGLVVRVLVPL